MTAHRKLWISFPPFVVKFELIDESLIELLSKWNPQIPMGWCITTAIISSTPRIIRVFKHWLPNFYSFPGHYFIPVLTSYSLWPVPASHFLIFPADVIVFREFIITAFFWFKDIYCGTEASGDPIPCVLLISSEIVCHHVVHTWFGLLWRHVKPDSRCECSITIFNKILWVV